MTNVINPLEAIQSDLVEKLYKLMQTINIGDIIKYFSTSAISTIIDFNTIPPDIAMRIVKGLRRINIEDLYLAEVKELIGKMFRDPRFVEMLCLSLKNYFENHYRLLLIGLIERICRPICYKICYEARSSYEVMLYT